MTNHDVLSIVKEEVGHCWKNLAKELKFNRGEIEMISMEEKEHNECCNKVLERWCQDNGEEEEEDKRPYACTEQIRSCGHEQTRNQLFKPDVKCLIM